MQVEKYSKFLKGCSAFGISLNETQLMQFETYYELLIKWNQVMNLTAITEFEEVMQKHFVDSISVTGFMSMQDKKSILDVGTGAGFPGIPLKIVYPHLQMVLLDSLNKRIRFLDEVVEKLKLDGIKTVHGRAEDAARKEEYRENFDLVVSRAVANLSSLSEYCIPFVKKEGYFVSYKSGNASEEILQAEQAIHVMGGKLEKIEKFVLPDSDMERIFVMIKKIDHTPKKYPRKAGMIKKEPIREKRSL